MVPTTTAIADFLDRRQVMDMGIRPLWTPMPRLSGPAYTVRCPTGDNLMLHAAIYRASPGSVIVVESGDVDHALAGGNVCAVAQRRGIAGFVLDGLIRDVGEVREAGFPVFGRGVIPIPGVKKAVEPLDVPVLCGGVTVNPGDYVVADEDGVVVIPASRTAALLDAVAARPDDDLDAWEAAHRARVDSLVGAPTPSPRHHDGTNHQGHD